MVTLCVLIGVLVSLLIGAAIRHWKVTGVLLVLFYGYMQTLPHHDSPDDIRKKTLAYDPKVFTDEEMEKSLQVIVPAHESDSAEWPVTISNSSKRAFTSMMEVTCDATETILDGTTNWVIGVKQYPFHMVERVDVSANSIATYTFERISDEYGPLMNLTNCEMHKTESSARNGRKEYESKWVKVTPIGAARASQIGYTWMHLPLTANSENYQSTW